MSHSRMKKLRNLFINLLSCVFYTSALEKIHMYPYSLNRTFQIGLKFAQCSNIGIVQFILLSVNSSNRSNFFVITFHSLGFLC